MDEDEELYREMNEEDPYYMGDPEDGEKENDRPKPRKTNERKLTAAERKAQKKLDLFWNILIGIAFIAFLWWLIFT